MADGEGFETDIQSSCIDCCALLSKTAPVWERGILKDEYDVDFSDMEWFCGAVEPSKIARPEKVKLELPIKITHIPQGKCLAQVCGRTLTSCCTVANGSSVDVSRWRD
jgi:hypothetical protein